MSGFALPRADDEPLRILLVEDSRADAELLVAMLEDELPNALVSVSDSVASAVPLLAGPLDIAITDLSLPDAEGLQALTAILAARPDIAVVVMTGRQDHQLALQALSAGAEDYLVKGSHDARGVATAVLYAAQRRSAEQKAHRYERLALSLLDAMEASTCAVDATGTIIAVNASWRAFALANGGAAEDVAVGKSYLSACDDADGQDGPVAAEVAHGLRALLAGRLPRYERDYACHSGQEERWLSVRINPLPESGAVITHVDMSAAKRAERALSHLTLHDVLTDLPNRDLLLDRLAQALTWGRRDGLAVAVGFLDLDRFKGVNDSYGHAAGDELLRAVGRRLSGQLRQGDTLSRLAGDEFAVVWPGVSTSKEAEQLAARLNEAFEEPFVLQAATVVVTASIGVATGGLPSTAEDLLLAADTAMYDAKHHGRGRTRMYTDDLREDVDTRLRIEVELRAALCRDELVLHYQPVVDLQTGAVTGVEALVRWQHPDGLRMPDSFIPVAEASGLIVPLGSWVLEEACRQGALWAEQGLPLQMAVNFSARQISHPDVIGTVQRVLAETGLPAHQLLVEVTESTVMEDAELAQVALAALTATGVSVAIDDFGTGYSSLLYLKRYPIGALKVDRAFVAGMGCKEDDHAIVASVVSLARAVGAVCIAEGVETAEQHAALRALGCDYAQGFLFSRPVPAEQLPAALEDCARVLSQPLPRRRAPRVASALPVPQHVRRRIAQLHAEGGSLHTIAAALNGEHRMNPDGRRWHSASVAKVLARPADDDG
jgi:diguanylate cyclase (GGDEF)-like protein